MLLMVVKSISEQRLYGLSSCDFFFFLKTTVPHAFSLQYYNQHLNVIVQNEHLIHISRHQS